MAVVTPAVEVILVSDCEAEGGWSGPAAVHLMEWELDRMRRFRKQEDQARFAAAHLLVRWAMTRRFGQRALPLTLDQTERGKPFVTQPTHARKTAFSLSHTRGLVGCALSSGESVGLDLESMARRLAVQELLSEVLSPDELSQWQLSLGVLAGDAGLERFLEIWTLKEALSKALGVGLGVAPSLWSFDLTSSPIRRLESMPDEFGDPTHWQFERTRSADGHVVSLALPNPESKPVSVQWTWMEGHELCAAMR